MLSESQQKPDIPVSITDSRTALEPICNLSDKSGVHYLQIMEISGKANSIRPLSPEVTNGWRIPPTLTSLRIDIVKLIKLLKNRLYFIFTLNVVSAICLAHIIILDLNTFIILNNKYT
jgi:hypothetical protein